MIYGNGKRVENEWMLEDCTIGRGVWRNFEGSVGSFTVFLPEELFLALQEEGWYVKDRTAKYEEGDTRRFQLEVSYGYDMYPPRITMYAADGTSTLLNKESISLLQSADFEKVDLTIRPRNWSRDGSSGVKAYVKEMDVWVKAPARRVSASFNGHDDDD